MDSNKTIASMPSPPYYSVIFTSVRSDGEDAVYAETSARMLELAAKQDGFLGVESVRNEEGIGITVSYWRDIEAIRSWHQETEHKAAQSNGRLRWYDSFAVRICRVERHYEFDSSN